MTLESVFSSRFEFIYTAIINRASMLRFTGNSKTSSFTAIVRKMIKENSQSI
jgi:hypothetical protein